MAAATIGRGPRQAPVPWGHLLGRSVPSGPVATTAVIPPAHRLARVDKPGASAVTEPPVRTTQARRGVIISVDGPSGAGKSTHADHDKRNQLLDELQDAAGLAGRMVMERDILRRAEQLLKS